MDPDDITEDEAQALLTAAQEVVQLATSKAKAISPHHVVASVLAVIETAHASLLAAAVLAQYGEQAAGELEPALGVAKSHLGHFAACFVGNGVELIKSGEIPAEMLEAMPALRTPEAP